MATNPKPNQPMRAVDRNLFQTRSSLKIILEEIVEISSHY